MHVHFSAAYQFKAFHYEYKSFLYIYVWLEILYKCFNFKTTLSGRFRIYLAFIDFSRLCRKDSCLFFLILHCAKFIFNIKIKDNNNSSCVSNGVSFIFIVLHSIILCSIFMKFPYTFFKKHRNLR